MRCTSLGNVAMYSSMFLGGAVLPVIGLSRARGLVAREFGKIPVAGPRTAELPNDTNDMNLHEYGGAEWIWLYSWHSYHSRDSAAQQSVALAARSQTTAIPDIPEEPKKRGAGWAPPPALFSAPVPTTGSSPRSPTRRRAAPAAGTRRRSRAAARPAGRAP